MSTQNDKAANAAPALVEVALLCALILLLYIAVMVTASAVSDVLHEPRCMAAPATQPAHPQPERRL